MVFYLVGLGLGDPKDITVKGLEIVKSCKKVYLEAYTSILCHGPTENELEQFYGRKLLLADRELVEQNSDELLKCDGDSCLLVVGDPFSATTHSDLFVRAKQLGIEVEIIHNASILNAVACCGLQLYRFGETVSIVFWTENWRPDSFHDKIVANLDRGLHTLCLLDIKIKEQSEENLMRNRKIFEEPRYMTCAEAAEQLLQIGKAKNGPALNSETKCVGLARIGWKTQQILFCSLEKMKTTDLGTPLHSLVICAGNLHPVELEMLQFFETKS